MNEVNQGYVYSKQIVKLEELQKLIEELGSQERENQETYYFLRSPHKVSGICMKLPEEFPTAEGQMFNANCELRWKKRKSDYDVLVLSRDELNLVGFQPIFKEYESSEEKEEDKKPKPKKWIISDFDAYFYNNEIKSRTKFPTKFPKGFTLKGLENQEIEPKAIEIGQRYFKDKDTATVHFIALTILQEISQKNA